MRKSKFAALLASTAFVGMSPAEQKMGRFMRSPDEHAAAPAPSPAPTPAAGEEAPAEPDFAAFEKAAMTGEEPPAKEEPAKTGAEAEAGDDDGDDGEDGDDAAAAEAAAEGEKPAEPKKKTAQERIREINAKLRATEARLESERKGWEARLERIEKGLPADKTDDTNADQAVAPDPTDLEKYPLGVLDDRYFEDRLKFEVAQRVEEQLASVLQREQQLDQQAESERIAQTLQAQAEALASKGAEIFDDYDEVVVKAAMAGEFDLAQPTFEACAEAEHGAEILHILASDKTEAARVAKLSPFQQTKYVLGKNEEIAGTKPPAPKPNKIPRAETPPADTVRGAGARQAITPDTTDFAAFEAMANGKK